MYQKCSSLFEPHTHTILRHKGGALVEFGRHVILDEVEGSIVTRYEILEQPNDIHSTFIASTKYLPYVTNIYLVRLRMKDLYALHSASDRKNQVIRAVDCLQLLFRLEESSFACISVWGKQEAPVLLLTNYIKK